MGKFKSFIAAVGLCFVSIPAANATIVGTVTIVDPSILPFDLSGTIDGPPTSSLSGFDTASDDYLGIILNSGDAPSSATRVVDTGGFSIGSNLLSFGLVCDGALGGTGPHIQLGFFTSIVPDDVTSVGDVVTAPSVFMVFDAPHNLTEADLAGASIYHGTVNGDLAQSTFQGVFNPVTTAIPEPWTLALIGLGLAGLCVARRRRLG